MIREVHLKRQMSFNGDLAKNSVKEKKTKSHKKWQRPRRETISTALLRNRQLWDMYIQCYTHVHKPGSSVRCFVGSTHDQDIRVWGRLPGHTPLYFHSENGHSSREQQLLSLAVLHAPGEQQLSLFCSACPSLLFYLQNGHSSGEQQLSLFCSACRWKWPQQRWATIN